MELARQEVIEAASQARHPVGQLMDKGPLSGRERPGFPSKSDVQTKSAR